MLLSCYYPERIIYDDECRLKTMLGEFCTERGDSSVQEAGEDGCGSGQVTFQESCGSMVHSQLQPPRSK